MAKKEKEALYRIYQSSIALWEIELEKDYMLVREYLENNK